MKLAAILLISLVAGLMLTGCAAPEEPEAPQEPGPTEIDKSLEDAEAIGSDLDTADLDQIEQDLADLDW